MSAIVDTLILGPEELITLESKYPRCLTTKLTNTNQPFEHYRVIIEDEDEENYYEWVVDSGIAMSSHKFCSRVRSDKIFAVRIEIKMRASEEPEFRQEHLREENLL